MIRSSLLVLWLLAALGAGCSGSFSMRTPEGFVRVDGDYERRLANADGIVVGVRELDNDPQGNLRFWSGTIAARLAQRYEPLESVDVRTRRGLRGRQLRWRAHLEGRTWIYWTTLFVSGDSVYIVEAAGDEEIFGAHEPTVSSAIQSFEPG